MLSSSYRAGGELLSHSDFSKLSCATTSLAEPDQKTFSLTSLLNTQEHPWILSGTCSHAGEEITVHYLRNGTEIGLGEDLLCDVSNRFSIRSILAGPEASYSVRHGDASVTVATGCTQCETKFEWQGDTCVGQNRCTGCNLGGSWTADPFDCPDRGLASPPPPDPVENGLKASCKLDDEGVNATVRISSKRRGRIQARGNDDGLWESPENATTFSFSFSPMTHRTVDEPVFSIGQGSQTIEVKCPAFSYGLKCNDSSMEASGAEVVTTDCEAFGPITGFGTDNFSAGFISPYEVRRATFTAIPAPCGGGSNTSTVQVYKHGGTIAASLPITVTNNSPCEED